MKQAKLDFERLANGEKIIVKKHILSRIDDASIRKGVEFFLNPDNIIT